MLLGTQNQNQNQNHANIAASKGATDFSIAAIMARGSSSREPSERSISKLNFDYTSVNYCHAYYKVIYNYYIYI